MADKQRDAGQNTAGAVPTPDSSHEPPSSTAVAAEAPTAPATDDLIAQLEVRIEQLDAELHEARRQAEEYQERWLRAEADRQNTLRRARVEADEARRFANQQLVSELLVVLDNFEHALRSAGQAEVPPAYREGVELIYRQLQDVLQRFGVAPIPAVGQPFDPNLHEAILQVEPQAGQAPHQVVEELRKGYQLHDRVLRPSLVKVTAG
ncbi:MAG: nucleotide exchange factor GrpE [Armatimonadetes bacterium]|nr:nucleotide exchange factor GrpE [Armatimonadota bacterium]